MTHPPTTLIQFPPDPAARGRPPRCRSCGYVLTGVGHTSCPECGRLFSAEVPGTYTHDRPYRRLHYWWPGLLFAVGGTLCWAVFFYLIDAMGWGLFLGVPWTLGAMLGYSSGARQGLGRAVGFVLAAVSALFLIGMLMAGGLAGAFCAVILLVVYIPLAWIGVMLGIAMVRGFAGLLAQTKFEQRDHLPVLLLLIAPGLFHGAEVLFGPAVGPTQVATTGVIQAQPVEAYRVRTFYAQTHDRPGLLLRLGQPRPVGMDGRLDAPGDIVRCHYTKDGLIVIRLTQARPGEVMAFDVVRQHNIEDHSAALLGGSFAFKPAGDGATRVTITSRYQPKLTPRTLWKPIESLFAHELHEHVLEDMRQRAERRRYGDS